MTTIQGFIVCEAGTGTPIEPQSWGIGTDPETHDRSVLVALDVESALTMLDNQLQLEDYARPLDVRRVEIKVLPYRRDLQQLGQLAGAAE
jgi:hypothetical protein